MPIFKNVTENSSGNVGIGTTSPTYRVSTQGTGDHRIYHYNSGTTTSDNAIIQAEVAGDNSGNAFFCAGKTGTVWSLGRNTSTGNFEIRSNFNLANDASSRMIIKTDGSVGIGTTNPNAKLTVGGAVATNLSPIAIFDSTGNKPLFVGQTSDSLGLMIGHDGNDIQGRTGANFTANGNLIINRYGGNVGIGTTNPGYKLDVVGDISARGSDPYFILTPNSGTYVFFQKLSTSNGNYLRLYDGTNYSMFWKDTKVGIGTDAPGEKLHVEGALRVLSNGSARGIYIRAASANSGNIIQFEESDGTQLWEIVGRGYSAAYPFYIYKTSGTGSGYRYYINSSGNHTFTGDVTVTGTITESSSKTIKQNINPITDALSIINSITGYTYDRKDGTATNQSGFIAEEVAEVLPGVVSLDQEGNPTGVQYTKIIAYLVESIKELKSELDVLKRQ